MEFLTLGCCRTSTSRWRRRNEAALEAVLAPIANAARVLRIRRGYDPDAGCARVVWLRDHRGGEADFTRVVSRCGRRLRGAARGLSCVRRTGGRQSEQPHVQRDWKSERKIALAGERQRLADT